jgi:hypothetical protein
MSRERWTINHLKETDDLTFAIRVLLERKEELNRYAPLAQRIQKVINELRELRDICRANPDYAAGNISAKEAIYRAVEREYRLNDIKQHLGIDEPDKICDVNISGMNPNQVWNDREIMDKILDLMDNYAFYWDVTTECIEHGIGDVLEARKE